MQATKLTTLASVKQVLEIPPGDTTGDANIDMIITMMSAAIESYLRRKLSKQDYTDIYIAPSYFQWLHIPEYPVLNISSLKHGDEEVGADQYRLNCESGEITLVNPKRHNTWRQDVTISYTAGYTLPDDDDPPDNPRTLPMEIEYACMLWVQQTITIGQSVGIKQERVKDLSVTYESPFSLYLSTSGKPFPAPPAIMALLAPHRRMGG